MEGARQTPEVAKDRGTAGGESIRLKKLHPSLAQINNWGSLFGVCEGSRECQRFHKSGCTEHISTNSLALATRAHSTDANSPQSYWLRNQDMTTCPKACTRTLLLLPNTAQKRKKKKKIAPIFRATPPLSPPPPPPPRPLSLSPRLFRSSSERRLLRQSPLARSTTATAATSPGSQRL